MKTPEDIADMIWGHQNLMHEETMFDHMAWEDFVDWMKGEENEIAPTVELNELNELNELEYLDEMALTFKECVDFIQSRVNVGEKITRPAVRGQIWADIFAISKWARLCRDHDPALIAAGKKNNEK